MYTFWVKVGWGSHWKATFEHFNFPTMIQYGFRHKKLKRNAKYDVVCWVPTKEDAIDAQRRFRVLVLLEQIYDNGETIVYLPNSKKQFITTWNLETTEQWLEVVVSHLNEEFDLVPVETSQPQVEASEPQVEASEPQVEASEPQVEI